jgi:hypothetical protein
MASRRLQLGHETVDDFLQAFGARLRYVHVPLSVAPTVEVDRSMRAGLPV